MGIAGEAVGYILKYGARKQDRFLTNDPNISPKSLYIEILDILPVVGYGSRIGVVKPLDEAAYGAATSEATRRGGYLCEFVDMLCVSLAVSSLTPAVASGLLQRSPLPAPRFPHQGHHFTGRYIQRYVTEDGLGGTGGVGEGNVREEDSGGLGGGGGSWVHGITARSEAMSRRSLVMQKYAVCRVCCRFGAGSPFAPHPWGFDLPVHHLEYLVPRPAALSKRRVTLEYLQGVLLELALVKHECQQDRRAHAGGMDEPGAYVE